MIIYFMGTRNIFDTSEVTRGISTTNRPKSVGKYKEQQNFLIGNMGDKAKFLIGQENMYPTKEVFNRKLKHACF